jgi:hypothetical protein
MAPSRAVGGPPTSKNARHRSRAFEQQISRVAQINKLATQWCENAVALGGELKPLKESFPVAENHGVGRGHDDRPRRSGCVEIPTDLCAPTYSFNSAGKMVLESKDDLKKRGHRSPDIADSLALTFALPVRPKSPVYARNRHDSGDGYNPMSEMVDRAGRQHRGGWN